MAGQDFAPEFLEYFDPQGRRFEYVRVRHGGSSGLGVHLSAFFGKWGEQKRYRDTFSGYFHRLRMLGSDPSHDWLFLCDAYGAYGNGCYYAGERGDLFVERATMEILRREIDAAGFTPDDVVTIGSSMGATGAFVTGLQLGARGIVAIVPHVDLDVAALQCSRIDEVAYVCPDGDPAAEHNWPYTRRVRGLIATSERLPHLFLGACEDDPGVYREQVVPLINSWTAGGGWCETDIRPRGGHTSDFATRAVLLDAVGRLLAGTAVDPDRYKLEPRFAGSQTREAWRDALVRIVSTHIRPRRRLRAISHRLRAPH